MYCKIIDVRAFHGSSDLKPLMVRFTASLFHGTTYLLEQYGTYVVVSDHLPVLSSGTVTGSHDVQPVCFNMTVPAVSAFRLGLPCIVDWH
jgi:hypothetical protein